MAALVELSSTVISTNRYAPAGSDAVRLYNYNGAEDLTIAQLVAAVCVRRVAQVEDQAVASMNLMMNTTDVLEKLSQEINEMVAIDINVPDPDWAERRKRLIDMGCEASGLPAAITTYKDRLQAYETVQKRIEALNSVSDRAGIELQTSASRRDAVFTLATNTTTHIGASMAQQANAMKRG